MRDYLLAVDGGGTKTRWCVSDRKGRVLFTAEAGPASHKAVGPAEAEKNLRIVLQGLIREGVTPDKVAFGVWGLSGCDTKEDRILQKDIISRLGFEEERFLLCNDAVLAFYAQAAEPGMVLIAGTGSIAVGIDASGGMHRAGGWGYGFSDLGAGQWIGSEVLKETLRYCDGCRDYDPLFGLIREKFRAPDFDSLRYTISGLANQSEVAGLAPLVMDNRKTPLGRMVFDKASAHLAELGAVLCRRMEAEKEKAFSAVLSGGLFQNQAFAGLVTDRLCRAAGLPKDSLIQLPARPVEGGIRLAGMLAGHGAGGVLAGALLPENGDRKERKVEKWVKN